jgi:hypothetical protein
MLNSTSNPRGSANARSASRDRGTPCAGASTADTGRSGTGDGDDVDGMAALLSWLAFSRRIPLAYTGKRHHDTHLPLPSPSMAAGLSSRRSVRARSAVG